MSDVLLSTRGPNKMACLQNYHNRNMLATIKNQALSTLVVPKFAICCKPAGNTVL
jgi:hypothetical protein